MAFYMFFCFSYLSFVNTLALVYFSGNTICSIKWWFVHNKPNKQKSMLSPGPQCSKACRTLLSKMNALADFSPAISTVGYSVFFNLILCFTESLWRPTQPSRFPLTLLEGLIFPYWILSLCVILWFCLYLLTPFVSLLLCHPSLIFLTGNSLCTTSFIITEKTHLSGIYFWGNPHSEPFYNPTEFNKSLPSYLFKKCWLMQRQWKVAFLFFPRN